MRKLKVIKFYISILFIILVSAACRQKYIWFTELQRTHEADHDRIVRVYMDRFGDFYPSDKIYIDNRYFIPEKPLNTINSGRLEHYFTSNQNRLAELRKLYNESSTGNSSTDYRNIQRKILDDYIGKVNAIQNQYKSKQLVIIVHGFNDPNPTGTYQELRDVIAANGYDKDQNLLYIEIYWDGLTANGVSPGFSKIWGPAQFNSRYVALGLRSLMNKLPADLQIVMITHSLGASVGTGALFNTFYKWKDDKKSKAFIEIKKLSKEPYPKGPIKLGMIAAAIPGEATFHDYVYEPKSTTISSNDNIKRIVVALNPHDYALHKGVFGKSNFMAPRFGATTLGNNYKGEAENVRELLKKKYSNIDQFYFTVPFTTPTFGGRDQEHGLHFYLDDKEQTTKFLFELFKK